MDKQHYYLNIDLIKQLTEKRGLTAKQLAEGFDISEKIINNYLQGKVPKNVPLKIGYMFCLKLNIGFNDIITTAPPSLPSPFIKGEGGCEADG